MARVLVLGGGLAGLSAAAALGGAGHEVHVLEARAFPGGRATSYRVPAGDGGEETIDNCQHILLRCCVNLLDFYARLDARDCIEFHREFYFLEPGGRTSVMKAGLLPAPLHLTGSFATLKFLSWRDKIGIGRALLALRRERRTRRDLDSITMLDWLKEKGQTARAIDRFWRQVLVSAINEDLERMAALHGFQVVWLGFLAAADSYEMGVPSVPLGALYSVDRWSHLPNVRFSFRQTVTAVAREADHVAAVETGDATYRADHYVAALPSERLAPLLPDLGIDYAAFEPSPITGVHLWFDRPVTDLPHGTLMDRTLQWFFNKSEGRYLQLVISASRALLGMARGDVIALAVRELGEFLPAVRQARLVNAHVVKEVRATFSARCGLETIRPQPGTRLRNLTLAGDWTASGWPATMEGAVRSGYRAAEHVTRALGEPKRFLLPDIA
jgi:squalene-associated FAD-dependent desaturase